MSDAELVALGPAMVARLASLEEHFDDNGMDIWADFVEEVAGYVAALVAALDDAPLVTAEPTEAER